MADTKEECPECAECEDQGEIECPECMGHGHCVACGKDCDDCDGGYIACPVCL